MRLFSPNNPHNEYLFTQLFEVTKKGQSYTTLKYRHLSFKDKYF